MCGIPFAMHTSDNNDSLVQDAVEERIGKPVKQSSTSIAVEDWEPLGMLGDGAKNEGDLVQIFIAQARALRFIPEESIFNVRRGSRTEDGKRHRRPRIWRTTSSQGIPSTSPRSISSRR